MKKLWLFILVFAVVASCKDYAGNSTENERAYHSLVPLGAERIELRPGKRSLFVLATAESPYFEGWHGPMDSHTLFTADGTRVESYPEQLAFRVTASAMRPDLMVIDSDATLDLPDDTVNDYLLHLQFRVIIFHGLEQEQLQPQEIRLIGMPAAVPYGERVYQAYFNLPHPVPIEDRVVFEVISPSAEYRLCKFHLDLF